MIDSIKKIVNNQSKFLKLVFLVGLIIRVIFVFVSGEASHHDIVEHEIIAKNLYEGHGFSMHYDYPSFDSERTKLQSEPPQFEGAFIPPLNPFIIYLCFLVFGLNAKAFLLMMIFNAFISSATSIVIYYIVKQLNENIKYAIIAAIISTIFLPSVYAVITLSAASLYQFFALVTLLYAIKAIKSNKNQDFLLFGLFSGIQTLIRSEYLLLSLILGVSVFVSKFLLKNSQFNFKISIKQFSLFLVSFVIIVAPWSIRNTMLFGKFIPIVSHPWHEFWRGNNVMANGSRDSKTGRPIWINESIFPEIVRKIDSVPYNQNFELAVDSIYHIEYTNFTHIYPLEHKILILKRSLYFWLVDIESKKARHPIYVLFVFIATIPFYYVVYRMIKDKNKNDFALLLPFLVFCFYYTLLIALVNLETRYQVYLINTLIPFSGLAWAKYKSLAQKEESPDAITKAF